MISIFTVIYIVQYSDTPYSEEFICKIQWNIFSHADRMIKMFSPDYKIGDTIWIKPRREYTKKILAITYVTEANILSTNGLLMLDIEVQKLFNPIIQRKPTDNGYYIVLSEDGSVITATIDTMKLLMGLSNTVDEIQAMKPVPTIKDSTTGFSELMDAFNSNLNYLIVKSTNGITYHTQWYKSDIIHCILLSVAPVDEINGAIWISEPSDITIKFAVNNDITEVYTNKTTIKNTGKYSLEWHVVKNSMFTSSLTSGSLKPGYSIEITFTINDLDIHSIAIEAYGENSNCYDLLIIPIVYKNISIL